MSCQICSTNLGVAVGKFCFPKLQPQNKCHTPLYRTHFPVGSMLHPTNLKPIRTPSGFISCTCAHSFLILLHVAVLWRGLTLTPLISCMCVIEYAFVCGFAEESSCTPGFESELLVFKVHRDDLHQGKRLGRVIFNTCDGRTGTLFQSSDEWFDVDTDGTVTLKREVDLREGHKVFSVHAWDSSGKKHTVSVRVERVHHHEDHHMDTVMNISSPQMDSHSDDLVLMFPKSSTGLKRAKRGWVIPPVNVLENSRGPFPQFLVQIKSDYSLEAQMAYRITGEGADLDPNGTFTIESLSGNLFVTRPLDRETKASYRLMTHATGVGVNIIEKPMEITVNVMDQNDNYPNFTQNPFNGSVPEAAEIGHEFMTVTATDADDPDTDNAVIRYSIVKQDPESPNPESPMFQINSVTGGICVNSLGLDKDKWPKYTLTVVAADMEGRGLSTTGTAVITVTDSNDNAPQFDQTLHTVSVPENKVGALVAKLTVTDEDEEGSPAWSTKYRIISGDKGGFFSVSTGPSQLEGVITTVKVFLCEYVEGSSCTPGFESELLVFKVHRDHLHQGTILGRVIFNTCDGRTRTLFQSSDEWFDVDTDGTVTLKRRVDLLEGHKVFSVHAWDSSGKKHTVSVRVERVHHHEDHHMDTVMNISSPQMESPSDNLVLIFPKSSTGLKRAKRGWIIPPINVLENSRGPYPMKLVQIKLDYSLEAQMAYRITGEGADLDPKGIFTIDRLSGYLYVTRSLDRETKASYRIMTHATAVDVNIAEKPMEIIVSVLDQNDNMPFFTQNPLNGNVPEAAEIGHEFMSVTATDADDPETDNAEIRYSIVKQEPESPNPNMFQINSVTGGIRVNSSGLDKEKWSKYTLIVVAADMEGKGYSTTGTAVITVTDSNDNAPQAKRGWIIPPINVIENSRGPLPIKLVQIKSDYSLEAQMAYRITGEGADLDPNGTFTIDRLSGNMYVTRPLDRETKASYRLMTHATAVDVNVAHESMEIIVNVLDQNDNKPVFTQNPFNGNVPEDAGIGHEFMTVTATDADDPDTDNGVIRYSIVKQEPESPNPNMFQINTVTGGIYVNSLGLDKEKWSKYTLTVAVADMEGKGYSTNGTAVITVTDSNDNAPQFDQTSYTVSVPENKVGAEVAKLTVTDEDEEGSPAWSTKYRIISGDKGGFFNVSTGPNKLEGVITTVKPLDFEKNKQYILSVIVENDEPFVGSLATSTATVTVNVEDVNEPPEFDPKEEIIYKPEDSPVDTELVSYTATDPDIGKSQKITYKIGNDPDGWLSVNQDTGLIKVRKPMDRESSYVKDGKYKAIILAVDDDKTPATGTGTLIIELSDVNDNAPVINERTIEMCNRGSAPVLLSITDKDDPPYAGPFTVETQGETSKNWSTVMNETSTGLFLKPKSTLKQGKYNVVLRVFDQQRLFQDSTIQATVCDCEKGPCLRRHSFCLR
ncbi:protocadherin-16-like [Megalobrama amblycephala]|uniref:protocadherin-16-like n=1 Tax=Megalobrama amblycephala TaxID=75352 RepID=UPI002013D75C|nr:protocadherin-16-like [Megalobrama amblycephala]